MCSNKNIAIFLDGTWNKQDCMADKEENTNVVKMYKLVAERYHGHSEQVAFYHSGVGSEGTYLSKVFGGATGEGISKSIIEAYTTLGKYFDPGDKIYIFGFSRGAYSARSLAGLIRNCGVLSKEALADNPERGTRAYDFYKSPDPQKGPNSKEAAEFIDTYSHKTDIHFLGVWDTVGALGLPLHCMDEESEGFHRFHDTQLSTHVKNAFQALAIDEFRQAFLPCIWKINTDDTIQRVEQKWFVGAHSDIGGGYGDNDDLADITLKWMAQKAYECGLKFTIDPEELHLHDTPYKGLLHDSYDEFYNKNPITKFLKTLRPKKARSCVYGGNCSFHESVFQRVREDHAYKPFGMEGEEFLEKYAR